MKYQPPKPPSALEQAIGRLARRIWTLKQETEHLEDAKAELLKLHLADEKEREEDDKRRAAVKAGSAKKVPAVKKAAAPAKPKPGVLSAAARARIAAAQKKRWADYRKLPINTAKPAAGKDPNVPAAQTAGGGDA